MHVECFCMGALEIVKVNERVLGEPRVSPPVWDTSSDTTVVHDNKYKGRCYELCMGRQINSTYI